MSAAACAAAPARGGCRTAWGARDARARTEHRPRAPRPEASTQRHPARCLCAQHCDIAGSADTGERTAGARQAGGADVETGSQCGRAMRAQVARARASGRARGARFRSTRCGVAPRRPHSAERRACARAPRPGVPVDGVGPAACEDQGTQQRGQQQRLAPHRWMPHRPCLLEPRPPVHVDGP